MYFRLVDELCREVCDGNSNFKNAREMNFFKLTKVNFIFNCITMTVDFAWSVLFVSASVHFTIVQLNSKGQVI